MKTEDLEQITKRFNIQLVFFQIIARPEEGKKD